jgi:prohibitin 1
MLLRYLVPGAIFGAAMVAKFTTFTVDGGQRALMFNYMRGGLQDRIYEPGTHFYLPGVTFFTILPVRARPRVEVAATGTKDLQQVNIELRVLSRPKPEHLKQLYRSFGADFNERIMPSVVSEVLKAIVARHNGEQLITMRDRVSAEIKDTLHKRLDEEFNIVVEDVSITELRFGSEYIASIERKQVAFQESERAKFLVAKAEQEKKAEIIRAEGEAEAARIFGEAVSKSGRGYLQLKQLETQKSIAELLSKQRNVTYLPSTGSGILLNINPSALK